MASLTPATIPLDTRLAKHLLRRCSFNYSAERINSFIGMTISDAVDSLFTSFTNPIVKPSDPTDGYWIDDEGTVSYNGQGKKREYVSAWWFYNAIHDTSLRHKLTFFLFTSFTISKDAGKSSFLYDYLRLLDHYSFGSIKDVAYRITKDNLMLSYLDNASNIATNPNENYAREFLELFTIGKGPQISDTDYTTYTEADVVTAAKVLTGYKIGGNRSILDSITSLPSGYINTNKHDTTNKTFSAAFDNTTINGGSTEAEIIQEHNDFVDMVFSKQATAKSYCRKLYRYFVHSTIDTEIENDIIIPLSNQLLQDDYNIINTLKLLLKSQHFYDLDDTDSANESIGAIIKSPLQQATEILSFFSIPLPDPDTQVESYYNIFFKKFLSFVYFTNASMLPFQPYTVAGYPAYYQEPNYDELWFTSSTIISRYKLIDSFTTGRNKIAGNSFLIEATFDIPFFLLNQTFISDVSDPEILIDTLLLYLFPDPPSTARRNYILNDVFLDNNPTYYWTNAWYNYINSNSDIVIKPILQTLFNLLLATPESQLL